MSDLPSKVAIRHLEAMSNLRTRTTGITGVVVWVSSGEFAGKDLYHGPRFKVMLGDRLTTEGLAESVTVTLSDPPVIKGKLPAKISKQIVKWATLNRETLLQHWNGELDTAEMIQDLQSI